MYANKFSRRSLIVCPPILLMACASQGNKFDAANVDQLVPGRSTVNDAIALLGKPSATSYMADGSKLLQWQFVQAVMLSAHSAHVAILFDRGEIMVRVTHRFET